jgi:glycosyltransferase involved in cell wall biosynthesis
MTLSKVAVFPLVSTRNDVWRDSCFAEFWQTASALKDVFFYFLLGDGAEVPEKYQLPNVGVVNLPYWYTFVASESILSNDIYKLFNPMDGKYQVDAFIMSHSVIGAAAKRMLDMGDTCRVPVFISETKAADFNGTHDDVSENGLLLRSIGYATCPSIFHTPREKKVALSAATRYMLPSIVKKIDENSLVRSPGVFAKEVNAVANSIKKPDKFTVLFAARFNQNKRWPEILKVMETFCRANADSEAIAVTPSIPTCDQNFLSQFQKVKIVYALPRKEYVEALGAPHVSISLSNEEGFTLGFSEQIATGNPVLLPDRPWSRTLMPYPEYQFLFHKNEKELYGLLMYVKQNYEEVRARIKPAVDRFVEEHDVFNVAKTMRAFVEKNVENTYEVFKDWAPRLKGYLECLPDEFTMDDFIKVANADGMAFGCFYRQVNILATYRNLFFWLKENTKVMHTKEMRFKK